MFSRAAFVLPFLAVLPMACVAPTAQDAPANPDEGWVDLFNGKDLTGWVNVNCADDTFTPTEDGMLYCNGLPTGVMRTEKMYRNFVAEFEYKHMVTGGNAGFFVWADALTSKGVPFSRSIEVQIIDGWESENWTSHGDVFAIHGARMTPDRPHPAGWERCLPSERRANGTGEWNKFQITAVDGTIKLAVNGKEVAGGYDIQPRQGYLCLESEGGEVYFRNLRIKELPSIDPLDTALVATEDVGFKSIYNGRDFEGWDFKPEHDGSWVAKDWRLDYDGKSSDLWSLAEYGDMEMIVDWRWTGPAHKAMLPVVLANGDEDKNADGTPMRVEVDECGDSGVYLRGSSKSQVNIWCWPVGSGEVYGYRTDRRMSPEVRAGVTPTVNADAPLGEWNRFHIKMVGDRLSVALNGQVVIENAQLPGVAERGRIALQNHGNPLQFANIYIKEL
mgnify:CR=1 FL=1